MVTDAEEVSPTASSSELEQEDDDDDCYLSDQEDDALEESVLQVLEDERDEDCHWSSTSVCPPPPTIHRFILVVFVVRVPIASVVDGFLRLQVITKESLLAAQVIPRLERIEAFPEIEAFSLSLPW